MKKMFSYLLAVIFAFALSYSYGQGGFVPVYVTPNTSAYFTVNVPANSLVYVQSTDRLYNVLVACGRTVNMDWVLANGNRYDDASVASLSGYGYTYFVDTATAQNVYGVKSFKANMYFKDQLISQPHVNAIQFGNSVKATDTLFIGSAQYLLQTTTNKIKAEGSFAIPDTLNIGSTQWVRQASTNRLVSEGSIQATDTLLGAQANITTKITLGSQTITQSNVNTATFNNSLEATDTLFGGGASISDNVSIGGFMSATDYVGLLGVWLLDNSTPGEFQYANHGVWADFALIDTIGVKSKIKLMNLSDVNIQNKAGNGQVEILERDTTGTTAKVNITNVKLATADSARMNRIVISDTLQGLVLYTSAGVKYRLRVSPTGVLTAIAVP